MKEIIYDTSCEVENVFTQTFETIECTSLVGFGWIKNKFTDKPHNKKVN